MNLLEVIKELNGENKGELNLVDFINRKEYDKFSPYWKITIPYLGNHVELLKIEIKFGSDSNLKEAVISEKYKDYVITRNQTIPI